MEFTQELVLPACPFSICSGHGNKNETGTFCLVLGFKAKPSQKKDTPSTRKLTPLQKKNLGAQPQFGPSPQTADGSHERFSPTYRVPCQETCGYPQGLCLRISQFKKDSARPGCHAGSRSSPREASHKRVNRHCSGCD